MTTIILQIGFIVFWKKNYSTSTLDDFHGKPYASCFSDDYNCVAVINEARLYNLPLDSYADVVQ